MFKEIVDDGRRMTDIERSQKLTMSTSCSGELKIESNIDLKSGQSIRIVYQCIDKYFGPAVL